MASIKVSTAFISCSVVNAVSSAIVEHWHSSIFLKMSAVGRCEAMGVVRRVVFTCDMTRTRSEERPSHIEVAI